VAGGATGVARIAGKGGQMALDFTRRRPQVPYWPTTPLTREQMVGALRLAEQQDEAVLAIFRGNPRALSPSQVWAIGQENGRQWLLTSVRRSITNLTNADVLVHLHASRMGPYGRPEGLWALPAGAMAA
jgi:hypothetical protein